MILKIVIVFLFTLIACAPPPSGALHDRVARLEPIENVEVNVTVGFLETQRYCWANMPWQQLLVNTLTNGGVVMGCAEAFVDVAGVVKKCNVHLAFDIDAVREHELGHCTGRKDTY